MKEIKFRAWDELNNKMKYLILLGLHWECSDELTVYGVSNKYGNVSHTAPVMQFTGLKDKNGKEIYEEDIVKCFISGINKERVGVVKYWECTAAFAVTAMNGEAWHTIEFDLSNTPEIIGNIYENPELLGGE